MRIPFALILIGVTLTSIGCNSDLRCRRETALLRAEYLDLEDKYYSLLAQSNSSSVINAPNVVASNYENAVVLDSGIPVESGVSTVSSNPEVTYYDSPTYSQGEIISSGPIIARPEAVGSGLISNANVNSIDSSYIGSPNLAKPVDRNLELPPSVLETVDPPREFAPDLFDNRTPAVPSGSGSRTVPPPNEDPDDISILDLDADSPRLEAGFASVEKQRQRRSIVSQIKINSSVSRGENTDGAPGDDELKLLLQPMTDDGTVVEEAGNLTISVIDPAADQGQQQVGYWKFLRSETELFFARDEFGNQGLLLQLPWSGESPQHAHLTVFVKYETSQGAVVETTDEVTIDPVDPFNFWNQEHADDTTESGDWYQGQARRGRGARRGRDVESIRTRPINRTRNNNRGEDYYPNRPAWKPVR